MRKIGIIMNGVTGRMGANQHLGRSIAAIRKQGGIQLSDQSTAFQIQFCWALKSEILRHDSDELNWTDMGLAQMLKQESYSFYELLLSGNHLEVKSVKAIGFSKVCRGMRPIQVMKTSTRISVICSRMRASQTPS